MYVWIKYLIPLLLLFSTVYAHASNEAIEDAMHAKGSYSISGAFSPYDFAPLGDANPFDWAFTTADGTSYELQGNAPTDDNVFGWEQVSITPPSPQWHMFALGSDVDGDGSEKFDWILVSADVAHKFAYKLAGVSENGLFVYSDPLNIDYTVEEQTVTIVSNNTPFSIISNKKQPDGRRTIESLFEYDSKHHLIRQTYYMENGTPAMVIHNEYLNGDIVKIMTDYGADGTVDEFVTQTFDAHHRVKELFDMQNNKVADISYGLNDQGQVMKKMVNFTNGSYEEVAFIYDAKGRVLQSEALFIDGMIRTTLNIYNETTGTWSVQISERDGRSKDFNARAGDVTEYEMVVVMNNILFYSPMFMSGIFELIMEYYFSIMGAIWTTSIL